MDPPVVPAERLDGWRRVDETTDRPFAAGPVSVTASTVRYERDDRREPRPFFFASRLRIRPETPPNAALTRLVENRARTGFRDRLAERDVEAVESRGERTIAVDDPDAGKATLVTLRGRCALDGGTVPVEALLATWEAGPYLLAGGAYRLDGDATGVRRELLGLVRGVRPD
ncbi:hypothetical protein [Halorubrum halodurans]|uniref:Uncharacterized protein n=1 Tax=Halorubrum halodurans TaxID=1383851 RepID=A0A256IJB5_9EURY|nr:hypothetical protein [Halorubrum halodurans]OYR56237.1 hypothetical protein DJ70_09345 [Halorubrum halodurans]